MSIWWNPWTWGHGDSIRADELPSGATDPVDGYDPTQVRLDAGSIDPARDPDVAVSLALQAHNDAAVAFERGRITFDQLGELRQSLFDGYINNMTGLGDWLRDKSLGGNPLGPDFLVRVISGTESEDRWRGSDLGARIVETIPSEMTRRGWRVQIQPSDDDAALLDDARTAFRRLHARCVRKGDRRGAARVRAVMDELGVPGAGLLAQQAAAPSHEPGPLPDVDHSGTKVVEWLQERCKALQIQQALHEALNYRQAFGGGAIFMGLDDGEVDLTKSVDWRRVRGITHLTAFRGGWDGELIAWRYRNDPRRRGFGQPEIYMLRNLGVPISSPPAPGESFRAPQRIPAGPTGSLIFYVHASRLLVFPGRQVSRRVRVVLRGWSDSIFTRVDEVLAQYGQTWSGLAILLQEASLKVVKIQDAATLFASGKPADREKLKNRAIAMQMLESIAKVKFIDAREEFQRVEVGTLAGMAEVLREMALRISAASGIPLSRLMGQTQGGLGDASKGDQRDFYDYVSGEQESELTPNLEHIHKGLMLSDGSPTGGTLPARWSLTMAPLAQMDDQQRAAYRKMIADTDKVYVDMGAVTPEEVAGTRFGGDDFNDGPLVIDMEARRAMQESDPPPPTPGAASPALPGSPAVPALPPVSPTITQPQHAPSTPPAAPGGAAPMLGQEVRGDDRELPEHVPAGQPEGGQFASSGGGGGSSVSAHAKATLAPAKTTPVAKVKGPDGKIKPGAGAGAQLAPEVRAKLKELGATKLPAAHIAEVHLSSALTGHGDPNKGALMKWKDDKGRIQSVYSKEHERVQAEAKFARVEKAGPKIDAALDKTRAQALTSPAHAAVAVMAETGLRPGSDGSVAAHAHYGVTTMEARHVTISEGKAHIEYVGKEGVTNRATIDHPATVAAIQAHLAGKAPTDRLFPASKESVRAAAPEGVKLKDLRTVIGTRTATVELGKIVPKMTGDKKANAREIAGILKAVSTTVSGRLNNSPAMARKAYINPRVIKEWGAQHGVPPEWTKGPLE